MLVPGARLDLDSQFGGYGSPRLAHYVTSKSAIVGMTRAMARDAGPHAITVNALAPGLTLGEAAERIPAERHELYRLNPAAAYVAALDVTPQRIEAAVADITGTVVGAIAVAGGTEDQDQRCAEVALSTYL